jgi:hypothetical protein
MPIPGEEHDAAGVGQGELMAPSALVAPRS